MGYPGDISKSVMDGIMKQKASNTDNTPITVDEIKSILHGTNNPPKKKVVSAPVSQIGSNSLANGVNNSPGSLQSELNSIGQVHKPFQDITTTPQMQQQLQDQQQTPGFKPVTNFTPVKPITTSLTVDKSSTNPDEVAERLQIQADEKKRQQEEQENPGSWQNAFPMLKHAIGKVGASAAQFIANSARDAIGLTAPNTTAAQDIYQEVPVYNEHGTLIDTRSELTPYGKQIQAKNDPLGKFVMGMDAYQNEVNKSDKDNPLPHTFLGNTASGAINIAPDLAITALLPEEEAAGGGLLEKLKSAATNPFTKLQAAKGVMSGYNEAKKDGGNPIAGAIKGGAEGEISGTGMGVLGSFAGDVVSPQIIKGLDKVGLVKNGKFTKIGADALADATVFGAYPLASNLIQGKPIDWNDVQSGIGTGLGFAALHGRKTYAEHTDVEEQVKSTVKDAQGLALQNFINASPDAIMDAYKMPDNSGDLTAKAVDYAHQTMQETDIAKKKELAATASTFSKVAGVKATTEAILTDKNGFIKNIEESELPDAQKQALIDKANAVHKELDPIEQQKTALGKKITDVQQQIEQVQPLMEKETDPVKKTDYEVGIDNLTKIKDEAYKQLKGIVAKQHEELQKPDEQGTVNQAPVIEPVQPSAEGNTKVDDGANGNGGDKPVAEPIPEQTGNTDTGAAKTTNSFLENSIKTNSKYSELAKVLNGKLKGVKTYLIKNLLHPSGESIGGYQGNGHIYINDVGSEDTHERVFFHEALHQLTFDKINQFESGDYSNLSDTEIDAIKNLKRIYSDSKLQAGSFGKKVAGAHYGFTNIHEFISEAFTNTEFQRLLKEFKTEGNSPNLLKRFINTIADLIGLKNPTILDDIFHHTEKLITDPEQTEQSPIKTQNNEKGSTNAEEKGNSESQAGSKEKAQLPAEKEVVNPGGEKLPGTSDHAKQKAIDAITHSIIYSPDEKFDGHSPRFDFGMDTADKKKAFNDISKGNYDTAPAKKMIDKIMDWDKNDSYPIIEGSGGHAERKRGATAEEIQNQIDDAKANKIGELSPRQIEEFNQSAKDLGVTAEDIKAHEDYEQSRHNPGTRGSLSEVVQEPENDQRAGSPKGKGDKAAQEKPSAEPAVSEPAGEQRGSDGNTTAGERGERSGGAKLKIDKYELIQPSKLKGSAYDLGVGKHEDGTYSIVDKNSGLSISKSYDSKWEAINAYEKNREKLTPKIIDDAKAKLDIPDETPKKPLAKLSEQGEKRVNDVIENENGITVQQIKDYEQARQSATGLPASDGEQPERLSEVVQQPGDDKGAGKNENPEREGLREQPEKPQAAGKEEQLRRNLEDAKAELSKAAKKSRGSLNSGVNPELLKSMVKVIKAYADLGIHKFSEMVKDWIATYGKENFTDEDAEMLKSAYAAHVANLDPKERKPYNTLKELDEFMGDGLTVMRGLEPKASLPERVIPAKERLPVVKPKGEEKEAKENISWLGNLKDNRVRNLSQLKEYAKKMGDFNPLREVRKYATSKSQGSVILKTATQKIIGLVGKEGWNTLRDALVESRLRGAKERWNNFANDIANKSDSQTKEYFADGKTGQIYDLLDNLKGLGDENPASFATSLIAAHRYEDARTYISNVFKSAADNVLTLGKLSNGKTFDEQVTDGKFNDPKMQSALEAYKQYIETPIKESHESNEGIFSNALGDLDTYYPLTPTEEQDKHFVAGAKPYKTPLNPNNRFTTGQAQNYSREISDLSDSLTKSIRTNNKANALDALKQAKLIIDVPHNAPDDGTITLDGVAYKAVKEKIADGRTIIDDGKIVNTASKYVMMPAWLSKELKPVFDANSDYDKYSALGKTLNTLVKYQLGGPIEATAHTMRLLGGITNSMPFMQEWAYKNGIIGKAGGLVLNNPFVKTFLGMGKILSTDLTSDKALQTIQEMAKNGDIPEKTWTKTWSREFAELTGAKASRIKIGKLDIPNFTDFSPILYGKHSLDLKARVTMYNLVKAMNPEATPEMHTKMQQQLGVYTKALQSNLEKFVKHHGIAPFYSFGSAIYREGIKAVVGSSSLPLERPTIKELATKGGAQQMAKLSGYKAAQLLSAGIIGTTAYWMATYHAQTGVWPWEDPKSKLLRNPFPEFAKNDFTKSIFYNEKTGEWADLDFAAYANPYLNRGLRAIGAPKAYETAMLGGTLQQSLEAGGVQALNTSISPYTSSPVAQFAIGLSGNAPYITSLRDDKGRPALNLYRKTRTFDGLSQYGANAEVALQTLNPVVDFLGTQVTNMLGIKSLKSHADEGDSGTAAAFKFAFNIAFPRLWAPHGNDDSKAHFIEKERVSQEKEAEKEAQ